MFVSVNEAMDYTPRETLAVRSIQGLHRHFGQLQQFTVLGFQVPFPFHVLHLPIFVEVANQVSKEERKEGRCTFRSPYAAKDY